MYQAVNPNVAKLIAEGKYTNGLDYYTKVGQFEGDSQTKGFFTGTPGNDVIAGFGEDKNLAGVGIEASRDGSKYTFTLKSLGVGEIDTLIGDKRENGFYLGLPTSIDDSGKTTTQPLYIGKGTADYGLIRNFGQNDYVYLAGDPTNYIYKSEGGDFNIYDKTSDLIGVVQDVPQLQVSNYTPGTEGFTLGLTGAGFNEDGYLSLYPDIKQQIQQGYFQSALDQYLNVGQYEEGGWIISGTTGNDTLISWTQNAEVRLSGVPLAGGFEPSGYEPGQYYFGTNPETLGVGEVDILIHSTDTGTVTESLLGWFRNVDGTIQRYYVGQGDQDYALVKNFNKNDKDEIFQGGAPEDYTYEDVDGNLRISYQGDLVGIVEGVKFSDLEFADEGEGSGAFVLVGKPDTATPPPGFDEFLPNAKTFYVQPDAGNTSINNFNSQLDAIALVGSLDDYKLKTVDGNFQIFTNDGDLVAFVKGVSELKPFTGNSPDGSTYLVSSENEFFSKSIQPYFNEKFYFKQNPDVQGLIDAGQYTDAFDQYVRAGQFEVQREDTLFNGTSGNDLIYGIGDESVLVGVGVQDAVYRGGVDVQPTSLGVGEVDTLIGSPGENIFVLANNARINDKVQAFYIGNGDNDYAKIQRFDPKRDLIDIAGDPRDYTYEPVDGNLRISKDGDLIAIVEGVTELYPSTLR